MEEEPGVTPAGPRKEVKSGLPAFIIAIVILLTASGAARGGTFDRVIATVDDEVITLSSYYLFSKGLGVPVDQGKIDEEVLKKMMEEKVILHEAKRKGFEISDAELDKMIEEFKRENAFSQEDVERELKKEDLDMRSYRRLLKDRLTSVKLIEAEVDSKIIVTDKEIEEFYRANEKDFMSGPEKVVLKAIFLRLGEDATVTEITELKRKALKISAQLEKGESFESLVMQYDDDHLKSQGGRWGQFERGTLVPQLDRKVFSMKIGEISEPIWVRNGVYILKLEDRTGGTVRPLNEVAADINRYLRKQKRERLFNEWMKTLWEKASTKVN